MSNQEDDFFNWSGAAEPEQPPTQDYRKQLHIRVRPASEGHQVRGDPFAVLSGLWLLPEDKAYLHGFMGALKLPEHIQHSLLLEYRQRWERAAQRASNQNQSVYAGRRHANVWIQQGAKGFIDWS